MSVSLTAEGTEAYTNFSNVEGHVKVDLSQAMDIVSVTVKLEGLGHYQSELTCVGISKTKAKRFVADPRFQQSELTEVHKVYRLTTRIITSSFIYNK
jgi:hypothetical protein